MNSKWTWCGIGCMLSACISQAVAQTDSMALYTLYGVSSQSGKLVRYAFGDQQFEAVGLVFVEGVGYVDGIEGMAHIPEHLNIMGFWTDPNDHQTKLLYINSQTAHATVVGQSLGTGRITGATVAGLHSDSGDLDGTGGVISGHININPNKSTHNEFTLVETNHQLITRDDLHANSPLINGNTYHEGYARSIMVKPKGNGRQSSLYVDGVEHSLQNSQMYHITTEDPAGIPFKIYNDHVAQNGKAMGHWWIQCTGSVTGYIRNATTGGVFALQTIEAEEEDSIAFSIQQGAVVPTEDFAVKATVLGAAPGNNVPITVQLKIGQSILTPFGVFSDALEGDVHDDQNPRRYVSQGIHPAGTPIAVVGRSWAQGTGNSGHQAYLTVDTQTHATHALVLKNGDPVPNKASYLNPHQTRDFLRDFVDLNTATVVLDENQVMCLFELTTPDLTSVKADFDDLAVIVTFATSPSQLSEEDDDDTLAGPASRIVKVNRHTGGLEQIMTLDRVYTGLAAAHGGTFYASSGQQLYHLDPFQQLESPVNTMTYENVVGLEGVDSNFYGFTVQANKLLAVDVQTGQQIGSDIDLGVTDLHSIVFFKQQLFRDGYD